MQERITQIAQWHCEMSEALRQDTRFSDVRHCGTLAAFDLRVADEGYLASIGPKLYAFFLERGLLLRPLGNTIYIMPPYCITRDELASLYDAICAAADLFGARA